MHVILALQIEHPDEAALPNSFSIACKTWEVNMSNLEVGGLKKLRVQIVCENKVNRMFFLFRMSNPKVVIFTEKLQLL